MNKSNASAGFIDLATFDELEKYLYGGPNSTTYFIRNTKKATWFTTLPLSLNIEGSKHFNNIFYAEITRSADYLMYIWLEVTLPSVQFNPAATGTGLRWTSNLMHNLVSKITVEANDLVITSFTSEFLDAWAAFTTPAGKQVGYDRMIGNIPELTSPVYLGSSLPSIKLALPIPCFFTRDTGVALPVAALPYTTCKVSIALRDWTDLLIVDDTSTAAGLNPSRPATKADVSIVPVLQDVRVWAKYALVSNDERKRMGCAPRDILIEQVQEMNQYRINANQTNSFSIRFSHALKTLFFGLKNVTNIAQHSVYTNTSPLPGLILGTTPTITYDSPMPSSTPPIEYATLLYENTQRLSSMTDVYFSLIEPWYQPNGVIPLNKGFYTYNYSLDFLSCDPTGSTNYGKLTNVELSIALYNAAVQAMNGTLPLPNTFVFPPNWVGQNWWPQKLALFIIGVSNNIIRVSGGSIGFPVL